MTNYLTGLMYKVMKKLPDNQKSKGLMIRNSTAELFQCSTDNISLHLKNIFKDGELEENLMDDFKVFYDEEEDILYLAKEGGEAEVVEISPGVNMELDINGNLIGVELFKASHMFKNVLKPMEKKLQFA